MAVQEVKIPGRPEFEAGLGKEKSCQTQPFMAEARKFAAKLKLAGAA